jgi:hypothetical protein
MSNTVPPTIPAGWYSDPTDASQLRWWNGSAWSQHVQQRPAPISPTPVEAAPVVSAQVEAAQVEPAQAAVEPVRFTPVTETPLVRTQLVETAASVDDEAVPTRSNTVSSWFVALSPFYYAIAFIIALPALASIAGVAVLGAIAAAVLVIPFAIALIFAISDFSALKKRGIPRPAAPGWMFLTPLVYLIVRTVRVRRATGKGSAPLWVWIAAWAVSSAIIGISTVQIIPAVTNFQNSSSLARGIEDGMNSQGGKFQVTCPPTAPLTVGSTFTCSAFDAATQTRHSLVIDVVAGTNGQPTVQLRTVTPPITP